MGEEREGVSVRMQSLEQIEKGGLARLVTLQCEPRSVQESGEIRAATRALQTKSKYCVEEKLML